MALVGAPGLAQDASTPAGVEPLKPPPPPPPPPVAPLQFAPPPPLPAAPTSTPAVVPVPGSALSASLDPSNAAPITAPPAGPAVKRKVYGPIDPNERAAAAAPPGIPQVLADAATKATTDYPAVRGVEGAIHAAELDIKAAKWQRGPTASLQGVGFQGGNANAARSNLGVDLTIDQPIWTFGRIEYGIQRAEATLNAKKGGLAETRQAIALQVVQAYYQMVSTARRNEIMIAGKQILVDLTDSIGRRVEQEVSAAADRILAQSRVSQLDGDIAANVGSFLSARERYRQLTGDPTATLLQVPVYNAATAHPPAEGAYAEVQTCDPKRVRLQAETQVAIASAKIAKASLFPSLSAQFQQSEVLGTRVGLAARLQTSGGLSGLSAAESARVTAEASRFQIAQNELEARDALSQDLVENNTARERIGPLGAATIAAKDLVEAYRRQFVTGRKQWLDVVNEEREAINAEISQSDSEVQAMNSAARILIRTCRWQP